MTENTHRYPAHDDTAPVPVGASSYAGGGSERTEVLPPYAAPAPGGPIPPADRDDRPREGGRGRGRTAGLLVAALVLGAGGGVLGAVGYDAANDEPTDSTSEPAATATSSRSPLEQGSGSQDSAEDGATDSTGSVADPGSVEAVAAQVLPSVVKINVAGPSGSGSGSGVILSEDGEILTNNHVVEVAEEGGQLSVSFDDGTTADATIVGTDPVTDLAVIQAEGVSGLTPADIGDSDALGVGEQVVAVGSPFGLEATVTSGIVSALNRPVTVGDAATGSDTVYPAVQTDAAINPGNSGGPLINMDGQVVGINSSIRSNTSSLSGEGGSIGLGFAIPITQVLPIVEQLRNGEEATHARLGVTVGDDADENGLVTGARIQDVEPGSAAEEAGLESGDVVTAVDDKAVTGVDALIATIRGYRPDDSVTLTVLRGDETLTLDATLDSDAGDTTP